MKHYKVDAAELLPGIRVSTPELTGRGPVPGGRPHPELVRAADPNCNDAGLVLQHQALPEGLIPLLEIYP